MSTQVGCAALTADLPTILTYIQDGNLVLNTIQGFVSMYFISHPDPTLQTQVAAAIVKAQTALDAALRITQGTKDLTQDQFTAAFAPFMAAYDDLLTLVKPLGVNVNTNLVTVKVNANTLEVPAPLVAAKLK
jgi:hypothetical protein